MPHQNSLMLELGGACFSLPMPSGTACLFLSCRASLNRGCHMVAYKLLWRRRPHRILTAQKHWKEYLDAKTND